MQAIINFLRGSVRISITGAFPERFLNLCAQKSVAFWHLEWVDANTLRLRIARKDVKFLRTIAERTGCDLNLERRVGVPYFLARFRKRYALLVGFALALATACVLSRFILTIEVTGNSRVSTAAILSELHRQGVTIGIYGPSINERDVSHAVLISLQDLSFMSINLHGTRAEVIVRETDPAPALVDENIPTDVVSTATGIITQLEVLAGEAKFKEGDTVLAGETLISGVVDIKEPAYSTGDLGVMLVHAQGRVYARTWRTIRSMIPLQAEIKSYTGREKTRYALSLLGHRINFYGNGGISFPEYDKISKKQTLTLPGGMVIPITLSREVFRDYTTMEVPLNADAAEALLKEDLQQALQNAVGDGKVLRTDFSTVRENGFLTVTLLAECSEQIAKEVPMEGK